MKLIKEITDKEILGTAGLSQAKPRLTARAILKRRDGLYAVMYSEKFNLYSLAGGGIEKDEDIITALKREIMEETGCECDKINELGYVYENRAHCDYTQYSYYFVAETKGAVTAPEMTDSETANKTSCMWKPLKEVVDLIKTPVHNTNQRKFLQARDVAALNEYLKLNKAL